MKETSKRVVGAEHPDTLTSIGNLACTWKEQGRIAEAIELIMECVKLQTLVLGGDHPDTLSSSAALIAWKTETAGRRLMQYPMVKQIEFQRRKASFLKEQPVEEKQLLL